MKLQSLFVAFSLLLIAASVSTPQTNSRTPGKETETRCLAIRRLGYPFGKRTDLAKEIRYVLLDICPSYLRGQIARPVLELTVDGKREVREFDVVRFFEPSENKQSIERYARENGIKDFKVTDDDYLQLAFMRPVLHYLRAVKNNDWALYKEILTTKAREECDRDEKTCQKVFEDSRLRLEDLFAGDFSLADFDFKFTPNKVNNAGSVTIIYKGAAFSEAFEVRQNDRKQWEIDSVNLKEKS